MLAIQRINRPMLVSAALMMALLLTACSGAATTVAPEPQPTSSSADTIIDEPSAPEVLQLEIPLEAPSEVPEELKAIWEAWALLVREHVDRAKLDPEEATAAAIKGIVETLKDPHTHYVPPEAFDIQNQDLQGEFEGIGASVSMRLDGKLVVVAPIRGSPAEAAGIRPGDVILEVDGESIEGLSLLGAVAKIRGPRGSTVKILVQHLGAIDPVIVEITRGVIPLESVLLRSSPGDKIAHIRLTEFFADTAEDLSKTLKEVIDGGAEGLIIDVRDNPGGLLQSVIDVADMFLDADGLEDDALILYEIDANNRRTNFQVNKGGIATDIPMVILTNEFSASASEILVGALQDYNRATIVGATTFGKGSVNILRRLSNGGGLVITFARWYTPSGRLIQDNGLKPDIEVTSRDRQTAEAMQLEKAKEVLESKLGIGSAS